MSIDADWVVSCTHYFLLIFGSLDAVAFHPNQHFESCNENRMSQSLVSLCRRLKHASIMRSSFRPNCFCIPYLRVFAGSLSTSPTTDKADFKNFYRFQYIRFFRFLSRLKIYQTGLTVVFIPPTVYCYSVGLVGIEACMGSIGLSAFAMTLLYFAGNFFRRIVGLVALSSDEQIVRISRLTFWGNRRDIFVSPSDIVPISDLPDNVNDPYIKLRLYNSKDVLYLTLRYGIVVDPVSFAKVFGHY